MKTVCLLVLLALARVASAAEPVKIESRIGEAPAGALPSRLVVVSWNVEKSRQATFGAEYRRITAGAHLVALQEATTRRSLTGLAQLAALRQPFQFCFVGPLGYDDGVAGTATGAAVRAASRGLFSRDHEPAIGTGKSSVLSEYALAGRRARLLVANTHGMNAAGKALVGIAPFERQLADVEAALKSHRGPLLWVGDFNTANRQKLAALYVVTKRLELVEVQFPPEEERKLMRGRFGRQALDRAFVRGLSVEKARCEATTGADHTAIVIEVRVP